MDELWKRMREYPEAKHVCEDFAVILACIGDGDVMMCRKCGRAWIAPCHIKGKEKGHKTSFDLRAHKRGATTKRKPRYYG
jgi:hypothetical protein